jgi:hypothetical protein
VIHVASRDTRVKATVSQAPSMGWGRYAHMSHANWFSKGSLRTRGTLEYPQPGAKEVGELKGGIIFEKLALFNPINDIKNLANCSVMFITVQNEELFKNSDHAGLAFETYTGNKKIVEIKTSQSKLVELGLNGILYKQKGLPERRLVNLMAEKKKLSLKYLTLRKSNLLMNCFSRCQNKIDK